MKTDAERFNAAVGRQLRAEIAAGGSSISAMARRLGIARSTLDNYVTGSRDIPVPMAYAVCDALGLRTSDFVTRAETRFIAESLDEVAQQRARRSVPAPVEDAGHRAVARPRETEPTDEQ